MRLAHVPKWRRYVDTDYGKRGPIWVEWRGTVTDAWNIPYIFTARVQVRVNGPSTAMARFYWTDVRCPLWRKQVYKHFKGRDAARQAKRWCKQMRGMLGLTVTDESVSSFRGGEDSPLEGWSAKEFAELRGKAK
jgi:hypothetical protein